MSIVDKTHHGPVIAPLYNFRSLFSYAGGVQLSK